MKAQPRKILRIHRKVSEDLPGVTATARLDRRTKKLATRLCPGDIAIIDHQDLDLTGADALAGCHVAAVVNAARSISGRYPNRGPQHLIEAGIPLIDDVGSEVFDRVKEGQRVRLDGDTLYAGDQVVAKGRQQDASTVAAAMAEAKVNVAAEIEAFAANTLDYIKHEYPLLDPRAHGVAAAELFSLPRAQRFQAVRGHDKRDAEELFRQESGHRNIPRMRVDDVDLRDRNHLRQVQAHGFESSFELLLRAFADEPPGLGAAHVQVAMVGSLIAPAVHFHFDLLRQFAAQVFHMHTGSAVDIGRVFARHQAHSHRETSETAV